MLSEEAWESGLYLEEGGLRWVQLSVALHLRWRRKAYLIKKKKCGFVLDHMVLWRAGGLTTASTAGELSPTTSREGHLGEGDR